MIYQSIFRHDLHMRSNQLPKHFSTPNNASTESSGDDESILSFLMCGNKKSHWGPSQGCTADDPSIRCLGRSKRRWFEPMCESSHCHRHHLLFVFQISPKTCKVAQVEQLLHDQFCRRNRRPSNKFRLIWHYTAIDTKLF